MSTDKDQIEALRARLFNKIKEKEQEIREIQAVYDSLAVAPKLLEGKPAPFKSEPVPEEKHRTLANRNVTELKGKDRSPYSAVHVILKKETGKGADLHYTKGIGFYKGRQPESTLVAEGLERPP